MNCCVALDQLRHHTTSSLQIREQRCDDQQQKKTSASSGLMELFPLRKNSWDHTLRDGTSSESTNVDDIMHTALVDAAVATASLNGSLGNGEVIHVQMLEKRTICVIKRESISSCVEEDKIRMALSHCVLRRRSGTMIFSHIFLYGGSGSLHGCSNKQIDGSVGFLPIEKLLDHLLHTAHVDAAIAEAPLNGPLGSGEVIHV